MSDQFPERFDEFEFIENEISCGDFGQLDQELLFDVEDQIELKRYDTMIFPKLVQVPDEFTTPVKKYQPYYERYKINGMDKEVTVISKPREFFTPERPNAPFSSLSKNSAISYANILGSMKSTGNFPNEPLQREFGNYTADMIYEAQSLYKANGGKCMEEINPLQLPSPFASAYKSLLECFIGNNRSFLYSMFFHVYHNYGNHEFLVRNTSHDFSSTMYLVYTFERTINLCRPPEWTLVNKENNNWSGIYFLYAYKNFLVILFKTKHASKKKRFVDHIDQIYQDYDRTVQIIYNPGSLFIEDYKEEYDFPILLTVFESNNIPVESNPLFLSVRLPNDNTYKPNPNMHTITLYSLFVYHAEMYSISLDNLVQCKKLQTKTGLVEYVKAIEIRLDTPKWKNKFKTRVQNTPFRLDIENIIPELKSPNKPVNEENVCKVYTKKQIHLFDLENKFKDMEIDKMLFYSPIIQWVAAMGEQKIADEIGKRKMLFVCGASNTGKTTLMHYLNSVLNIEMYQVTNSGSNILYYNGYDISQNVIFIDEITPMVLQNNIQDFLQMIEPGAQIRIKGKPNINHPYGVHFLLNSNYCLDCLTRGVKASKDALENRMLILELGKHNCKGKIWTEVTNMYEDLFSKNAFKHQNTCHYIMNLPPTLRAIAESPVKKRKCIEEDDKKFYFKKNIGNLKNIIFKCVVQGNEISIKLCKEQPVGLVEYLLIKNNDFECRSKVVHIKYKIHDIRTEIMNVPVKIYFDDHHKKIHCQFEKQVKIVLTEILKTGKRTLLVAGMPTSNVANADMFIILSYYTALIIERRCEECINAGKRQMRPTLKWFNMCPICLGENEQILDASDQKFKKTIKKMRGELAARINS